MCVCGVHDGETPISAPRLFVAVPEQVRVCVCVRNVYDGETPISAPRLFVAMPEQIPKV